jgi:hypothetical protein
MLLSMRAFGSCAAKNTVMAAITPTITQGCLKNFSNYNSLKQAAVSPLKSNRTLTPCVHANSLWRGFSVRAG